MKISTFLLLCYLSVFTGMFGAGCFNTLKAGESFINKQPKNDKSLIVKVEGHSASSLPRVKVLKIFSTVCPSDNSYEFFTVIRDGIIEIPVNCLPHGFLDRIEVLIEPPAGYLLWGEEISSRPRSSSGVIELVFTSKDLERTVNIRKSNMFHLVFVDMSDMGIPGLFRSLDHLIKTAKGQNEAVLFFVSNHQDPLLLFLDTNGSMHPQSINRNQFFNSLATMRPSSAIFNSDILLINRILDQYGLKESLDHMSLYVYTSGLSISQQVPGIKQLASYIADQNNTNTKSLYIMLEEANFTTLRAEDVVGGLPFELNMYSF